jgi:hypothetical protein
MKLSIKILFMDVISDLFTLIWLLIKWFFDQLFFYSSRLLSFIFRLKCDGCKNVDHVEDYFKGHYKKKFWCIPNRCYMISRCYKYGKKKIKNNKKKT